MFYFEETPVTGCAVQAGPQQEDANPSRQGFSVVIQKYDIWDWKGKKKNLLLTYQMTTQKTYQRIGY